MYYLSLLILGSPISTTGLDKDMLYVWLNLNKQLHRPVRIEFILS